MRATSLFGDRLVTRVPAWYRVGSQFTTEEKMTVSEGMRKANVMFAIDKHPLVVQMDSNGFTNTMIDTRGGGRLEKNRAISNTLDTKSFAVVREPTLDDPQHRVLGTVGKDWTALQPTALGRMLDPISETYPVETIGSVGNGECLFIILDAKESKIAGEDHHLYWMIVDKRDGTGGLTIAFTPVRITCQNMLVTGMKNAKVSINIKHNQSIEKDTSFYLDIFNQMGRVQDSIVSAMNTMTNNTLTDKKIKHIVQTAYPNASEPNRLKLSNGITPDDVSAKVWSRILMDRSEQNKEKSERQSRIDRIKDSAFERLDIFNQEFSHMANTPWAVYNAIVETEDFRRGHDKSGTQMFGSRADAKARAFNTALAYAK